MSKIKNRSELDDLSQGIINWIKKNNKMYWLDKHLPLAINPDQKKKEVLCFCKKYGFIPNQKSKDLIQSKLGYQASYWNRMDKVFSQKLKKYPSFREFQSIKIKEKALTEVKKNGYRPTKKNMSINHFLHNKSKNFDAIFYKKYMSYPNQSTFNRNNKIKEMKKLFINGIFKGTESQLQFIRNHQDCFPEYKKIQGLERSLRTLNEILNWSILNNKQPTRGPNGISMKDCGNLEWQLASKFSDLKKRIKNLPSEHLAILNKIHTFPKSNKLENIKHVLKTKTPYVLNLTTKEVFRDRASAALSIDRNPSSLWQAIKRNHKCGGYFWAYCDKNGNVIK